MKDIQAVSRQIARKFHPQRIILFGSHAWGTPSEDSDVDLLVVMPFQGHPAYKVAEILTRVRTRIALDVLVESEDAVEERIARGDDFIRDIVQKGAILYDVSDA